MAERIASGTRAEGADTPRPGWLAVEGRGRPATVRGGVSGPGLAGARVSKRPRALLKAGVWVLCLAPLGALLYRAATYDLSANPISFVTNWLGDWTLRMLLASLAMTPLRIVFGLSWPLALRRLLGLFAFFYGSLHFSVWIVLDHFFDWKQMGADILKRPYITVGLTALTLMLPLAATSTTRAVKWLGGRSWQRLHRLVYAVGVCGVLHYLWLAKKANPDPYYYAAGVALLLGVRGWDWLRRRAARLGPAPATLSRADGGGTGR